MNQTISTETETRTQTLNIFISYAHEDSIIATAAYTMLKQTFGGDVLADVFLDKESIRAGDDIADEIQNALKIADVLLVINTGQIKDSVSWTGWEVGYFDASHPPQKDTSNVRGKVITMCQTKPKPGPQDRRKYVLLEIDENLVEKTDETLNTSMPVSNKDALVHFLGDIYYSVTGDSLNNRADLRDVFVEKVKEFKKAVYKEFKNRIQRIRKPQKQLIIRYNSKNSDASMNELPSDTQLTSMGGALEVFNIREDEARLKDAEIREIPILGTRGTGALQAKSLDWIEFRNLTRANPSADHWASTLSKVVFSANVNVDNSQIIASHDGNHRYRVVLTTSTTYFNGEIQASVYLVETIHRPDYGREDTTLLLKGLHIVCRFRFLFMEPQSNLYWFNLEKIDALALPSLARQIIAELDLLRIEAKFAKLDNPGSWQAFVSLEDLDSMYKLWIPIRDKIIAVCNSALMLNGNREELQKCQLELTHSLKELAEKVTPSNSALLKSMSIKLPQLAFDGHHPC